MAWGPCAGSVRSRIDSARRTASALKMDIGRLLSVRWKGRTHHRPVAMGFAVVTPQTASGASSRGGSRIRRAIPLDTRTGSGGNETAEDAQEPRVHLRTGTSDRQGRWPAAWRGPAGRSLAED